MKAKSVDVQESIDEIEIAWMRGSAVSSYETRAYRLAFELNEAWS